MLSTLVADTQAWLSKHLDLSGHPRFLLGVSGGVDSMVLLACFRALSEQFGYGLEVVHVNHRIRADSDQDQALVVDYCQRHDLPLSVRIWQRPSDFGPVTEAAARQFRYACFDQLARSKACNYLVLAHHQDDQAETVLMGLLKAGRLSSLTGMPACRPLATDSDCLLVRPWLNVEKDFIYQVAKSTGIPYREDYSNQSDVYLRNRIRNRYLPELAGENPNFSQHLVQLAGQAQAYISWADQALDQFCNRALVSNQKGYKLDLTELRTYDIDQIVVALTAVFNRIQIDFPQLAQLSYQAKCDLARLLKKDQGQQEYPLPGNLVVIKVYDQAYIRPAQDDWSLAQAHYSNLALNQDYLFFDNLRICLLAVDPSRPVNLDQVSLRPRQAGDYLVLSQGQRQKLRRFLINHKVPAGQRDQLTLLARNQRVLMIVDQNGRILFFDNKEITEKSNLTITIN
ncbi:hypothetical protein AWM75_03715 [Aerococcus urinaehominis]|uniref:tRNA(Ile)-lysidine synthase n=1 Tax=Aerococcus urinaehominis TaxID=128944 RepID=A0A0X8FKV2_9LACT|nr:tRNA lysidine(34) synthetase TilS [Aerococcus urinaehominis]AMB99165.1 hypothetical protein AWM75_03715 [Aerococcus urinaehominis]SDM05956.1 tRNA(Ile)-lysidine synthase [Aerococcus urinaehominis]